MESLGEFEYNSKDLIGHGAFAVVFKGRHKKNTNFVVAIKSITKKNLAKSQNLLGKEIKILKELTELHHDNVVALLDCKETAHNVFLVMEYCNGGDLADYLGVKGTLSEDTIRLFLCQLAGAMRALNAKGIVHRDLKPQNILLSHSGGKSCPQPNEIRLKIADFGFARFLQDGVMAATLCGSPMYMAPEVIMSLQYDAKADLWSLGTIVFQCLTGRAPFQAQTPQALKQYYENNQNLAPRIPLGTSEPLTNLLLNLLRRNPKDRLDFDQFFAHPFLKKPTPVQSPIACSPPVFEARSPGRDADRPTFDPRISGKENVYYTGHPFHKKGSGSPVAGSPLDARTPGREERFGPRTSGREERFEPKSDGSSPDEDDYVLVPAHISSSDIIDKPLGVSASPPRPSFLPISEPIPVPTQRQRTQPNNRSPSNQPVSKTVPRSQPITMRRTEQQQHIGSLSPPAVQFVIGTPPGGAMRRRSASSSSCETPPPVTTWQVSPGSPLRPSGCSSPLLSGPLAMLPAADNNNLRRSPVIPFGTLPDISEGGGLQHLFHHDTPPGSSNALDQQPITFLAPELAEETLLEREHNETLAKLNFVLALADCVIELATSKASPLEGNRRAEQLVLLVRAVQLLGSGLSLATQQLRAGQLRPSSSVRNVVSVLNAKFRQCLSDCKQLNTPGLLQKAATIGADRILYEHAIQMCQSAALDELFGKPEECFRRYQTAQILLHSLAQQVHHQHDRALLNKYKDAVEKRLFVLQQQGYIYST